MFSDQKLTESNLFPPARPNRVRLLGLLFQFLLDATPGLCVVVYMGFTRCFADKPLEMLEMRVHTFRPLHVAALAGDPKGPHCNAEERARAGVHT